MGNTTQKLAALTDLGDKRLNKRLEKTVDRLAQNIKEPIPTASMNKATMKATYRFFENDKTDARKIIEGHRKTLIAGLENEEKPARILQLDDTTEFDFTGKRSNDDLGCLNYKNRKGIYLHNSLLMSDLGIPLGLLEQTMWSRDPEYLGNSAKRANWPLVEKESYRWYHHFKTGQALVKQTPGLEWVYVADREADFMELLSARTEERMHFLIRSQFNRNLLDDDLKLWDKVAEQQSVFTYKIKLENPETRKEREAQLEVRVCKVTIKTGRRTAGIRDLEPVEMNVIDISEINVPEGIDEPIHWVLLTTLPIDTVAQIKEAIKYYVCRWVIERFFYLMKTGGANIEELQLSTQRRLENAIATYSIAAMDVMKIRYLAENQPDTPINELGITAEEHEALYTVLNQEYSKKIVYDPNEVPTIREYCIAVGMLGGFFASKRQPLPGLKILSRAFGKYTLLVKFFNITRMSKNL